MLQACQNQWCKQSFEITDDDLAFYDKVSPIFAGKKYAIPPPTLCPDCRQQRRLAWRNEQHLYHRDCDLCHRRIVSVHKPITPFPVYCVSCFWSERWNPIDFGLEYDPKRPFFEQFKQLQDRVPQIAIQNDEGIGSENSEYCYDISRAKNCYRLVGSWYDEECHYSLNINRSKFVVDCNTVSIQSELVYESLDSQRVYHCAYVQNCQNCSDCFFGFDLKGCTDCFGCYGLRQKKFCIFNEPHTEEEYRKKMKEFNLGSWEAIVAMRKHFDEWTIQFPRLYANLQNCEDSQGNNLFNCKQVLGWSIFDSEYCKFVDRSDRPKNCYDLINTGGPEWCYDCVTPDDSYMTIFSAWCWKSKYILLSDNCHSSKNLCGCISLRRNEYCILNKQYTQDEYEKIVGEILNSLIAEGTWGSMLPVTLSLFSYNESPANEYFPLTKEDVEVRGWRWTDELPYTTGKETILWDAVPDDIAHVPDTVTDQIFACIDCQRNYKIIPQELSLYRKIPCPLPRRCPNCRHALRFHKKTPTHLWSRSCVKCAKNIQTTYSPERPEVVYCEECYLKEVY